VFLEGGWDYQEIRRKFFHFDDYLPHAGWSAAKRQVSSKVIIIIRRFLRERPERANGERNAVYAMGGKNHGPGGFAAGILTF